MGLRPISNLQWAQSAQRIEISTKLPVTYLEQAPLRGAVSNLHRYNNALRGAFTLLGRKMENFIFYRKIVSFFFLVGVMK
jgi:hypothetical protein